MTEYLKRCKSTKYYHKEDEYEELCFLSADATLNTQNNSIRLNDVRHNTPCPMQCSVQSPLTYVLWTLHYNFKLL